MLLVMVSTGHSAAGGVDCHSAAGTVDAAGSGCDSTDYVAPSASTGSFVADWCTDEYYSHRPIPKASSS